MNKQANITMAFWAGLFLPLFLLSCSGSTTGTGTGFPTPDDENYTGYLVEVESDEQFEDLLKSSLQPNADQGSPTNESFQDGLDVVAEEEVAAPTSPDPANDDSSDNDDFSGTTLIEAGVDEMDLVKFDGDIIYQSYRSDTGRDQVRLLRVPAGEASSTLISTIDLGSENYNTILGLYVYEKDATKTLVVLSEQYQYSTQTCSNDGGADINVEVDADCALIEPALVYWSSNHYVIAYYDVTSPESPGLIRSNDFKGSLLQSRRIGDRLYSISSVSVGVNDYNYYADSSAEIKSNKALLDELDFETLIPLVTDNNNGETSWFTSQDCYVPEGINASTYGLQLTVITSSDIENNSYSASCFLGYSQDFYASTNSLYFSEGFDWYSDNTRIHQFDYTELGVEYAGSGSVIGRLQSNGGSKFNMNEYEGHLRVLSSNQNFGFDFIEPALEIDDPVSSDEAIEVSVSIEAVAEAEHYLSILEKVEGKKELHLVSRIPNQDDDTRIGKDGERIYAVRFLQERAYVVTFRQIDPFYIIDLSDPLLPEVTGELEIPGYSTQLFPVNESFVLGIGEENGLKLDLYDVSDITNPVQSSQYLFGQDYYSPALYDHHSIAMLYDVSTESMKVALPAQSYGYYSSADPSAGLYLFNINASQGLINLGGSLITSDDDLSNQWNNVYDTRAIIDGDNFHFVTPQPVYSAPWMDTNDVSITP